MGGETEVIQRPAARVLLCDPADRVLLFKAQMYGRRFWITPGGGLNPGETPEEGALRELWEETGLTSAPDSLHCVWTRTHVFEWRGAMYEQRERYFLLRCEDGLEICYDNWEEEERRDLLEHRWWSAGKIATSDEVFAPRRLGELLRSLLQDGAPDTPIDVGR